MHRRSPVFIAILILVLGLTHVALYAAVVSIFSVTAIGARIGVLAVIFGLTALFILSMNIGSKKNNILTRLIYIPSSTWMGFFFYFFLASVVYAIAYLVLFSFVAVSTVHIVGMILMGIAVLISIAAVINAQTLRTTRVSVTLPNLPDSWKGRHIVFFSDIHLGQIYRQGFSRKLANRINSLHPDLVLIGGDLYDGLAVDPLEAARPLGDIRSTFGTYFVLGNHDEIKGPERYLKAIRELGITPLIDEKTTIDGIQLIGADYPTTLHAEGLKKVLTSMNVNPSQPSILIKHVPNDIDIAAEMGISLHLSGHTHRGQLFPLSLLTRHVYKGFDYGLKHAGSMVAYTSSGSGGWGPAMRFGTRSEVVLITLK